MKGTIPDSVRHHTAMNMFFPFTEQEAVQMLSQRLKPERFRHSLAVAKKAESLAKQYGCSEELAKMTGLLHDVYKNDNLDMQLQIIENSGIILTNIEKQSPPLLHAIAGAAYLKQLGITDEDVLNAVRYHTTGRAGMSKLEQIVFVADLTSEDRNYPDVDKARQLSEQSLEQTMLYALEFLLADLVGRKKLLHPDSVEAYNEMRMLENKKRSEN